MKRISLLLLTLSFIACSQASFENQPSQVLSPRVSVEEGMNDAVVLSHCDCGEGGRKVRICHVPPGNPENAHTICISRSALQKHLDNHEADNGDSDYMGACGDPDDGDDGDDNDDNDDDGPNPMPTPMPPGPTPNPDLDDI
ncbi:MAG TPA: hypothetical protein VFV50_10575 [Bdellovibrionales bacterium]|nr:hypothetical protein [Bdellovibrionales bacterium]